MKRLTAKVLLRRGEGQERSQLRVQSVRIRRQMLGAAKDSWSLKG
jgi:hypothetical protein